MKRHRPNVPDSAGLDWAHANRSEERQTCVQGLPCTLFEDDSFDPEDHLMQWQNDEHVLVDRYDVRHLLTSLQWKPDWETMAAYEGIIDESTEDELEDERYLDMHSAVEAHLAHPGGWFDPNKSPLMPDVEATEPSTGANAQPLGVPRVGYARQEAVQEASPNNPPILASIQTDLPEAFQPEFEIPESLHKPETLQMHKIMSQAAKFVKETGMQSIFVLRVKQGHNPKFSFLMPNDPLHAYFNWLIQEGLDIEAAAIAKKHAQEHKEGSVDEDPPETALGLLDSYGSDTPKSSQNPAFTSEDALEDSQSSEEPPILEPSSKTQAIMRKLAQAVKVRGAEFEAAIRRKESNNPTFAFLDSQDKYHAFYRKVLSEEVGLEKVNDMLGPLIKIRRASQPETTSLAAESSTQVTEDQAEKNSCYTAELNSEEKSHQQHQLNSNEQPVGGGGQETEEITFGPLPEFKAGIGMKPSKKNPTPKLSLPAFSMNEPSDEELVLEEPQKKAGEAKKIKRPSRYFVPPKLQEEDTAMESYLEESLAQGTIVSPDDPAHDLKGHTANDSALANPCGDVSAGETASRTEHDLEKASVAPGQPPFTIPDQRPHKRRNDKKSVPHSSSLEAAEAAPSLDSNQSPEDAQAGQGVIVEPEAKTSASQSHQKDEVEDLHQSLEPSVQNEVKVADVLHVPTPSDVPEPGPQTHSEDSHGDSGKKPEDSALELNTLVNTDELGSLEPEGSALSRPADDSIEAKKRKRRELAQKLLKAKLNARDGSEDPPAAHVHQPRELEEMEKRQKTVLAILKERQALLHEEGASDSSMDTPEEGEISGGLQRENLKGPLVNHSVRLPRLEELLEAKQAAAREENLGLSAPSSNGVKGQVEGHARRGGNGATGSSSETGSSTDERHRKKKRDRLPRGRSEESREERKRSQGARKRSKRERQSSRHRAHRKHRKERERNRSSSLSSSEGSRQKQRGSSEDSDDEPTSKAKKHSRRRSTPEGSTELDDVRRQGHRKRKSRKLSLTDDSESSIEVRERKKRRKGRSAASPHPDSRRHGMRSHRERNRHGSKHWHTSKSPVNEPVREMIAKDDLLMKVREMLNST